MSDKEEEEEVEPPYLRIKRPAYNQKRYRQEFAFAELDATTDDTYSKDLFATSHKQRRCSSSLFKTIFNDYIHPRNLLHIFTIIKFAIEYDFKKCFLADLFSGVTVGVMHIPAGLAYGALTSLNPVNGIYTSFFTGLTYIMFGTSRHLSVGTYAVISLMVFSSISRLEQKYMLLNLNNTNAAADNESSSPLFLLDIYDSNNNASNETNNFRRIMLELDDDKNNRNNNNYELKLKISSSLAFWCGIFQVYYLLNVVHFLFGFAFK